MTTYKIKIEKPAQRFLKRLNKTDKVRLIKAINNLPEGDTKPLQGHKDILRLRVGTYRIIYTKNNDELIICVIDAGNRGDIYKRY